MYRLLYKTWLNEPLVINLCLTASMSRCQIKRASQKESFFSLSLSIHNSIFFWLSSFERKLLWEIVGGFHVYISFMYSTTSNVFNSIKTIKFNHKHLRIHGKFFMSSRFLTCLFFIKKQLPTIMTKRVWTLPWGNVSQRTVTVIWHT